MTSWAARPAWRLEPLAAMTILVSMRLSQSRMGAQVSGQKTLAWT